MILYNKNSVLVNNFTEDILINSTIFKDSDFYVIDFRTEKYPSHNLFSYSIPEKNLIDSWKNKYFCEDCTTLEDVLNRFSFKSRHTLWNVFGKSVRKFLENEEKYNTLMFYTIFQDVFDRFQSNCFISNKSDFDKLHKLITDEHFFETIKINTGIDPVYIFQTVNFPLNSDVEMRYIYVCYIGEKKEEIKINKFFVNYLYQNV